MFFMINSQSVNILLKNNIVTNKDDIHYTADLHIFKLVKNEGYVENITYIYQYKETPSK